MTEIQFYQQIIADYTTKNNQEMVTIATKKYQSLINRKTNKLSERQTEMVAIVDFLAAHPSCGFTLSDIKNALRLSSIQKTTFLINELIKANKITKYQAYNCKMYYAIHGGEMDAWIKKRQY